MHLKVKIKNGDFSFWRKILADSVCARWHWCRFVGLPSPWKPSQKLFAARGVHRWKF